MHTRTTIRRLGWLLLTGLALGLAGCIGGGTKTPPDRYYSLPEKDPKKVLPKPVLKGVLAVERLQADTLRDDTHLLYVISDRPLEITKHDYRYWTNSPTILVQQRIYTYLSKAGFATQVMRYDPAIKVDYLLRARLQNFERLVSAHKLEVLVRLEISIVKYSGDVVFAPVSYTERLEYPRGGTADETIHASVQAFEHSLRRILDRFIRDYSARKSAKAKSGTNNKNKKASAARKR